MTAISADDRSSQSPLRSRASGFVSNRRPADRDLTEVDSLVDLSTGLWLWLAGANVVMQLANPGVGYGVLESRVESGRVDRHPIKRGRTTALYLAVATLGTEEDRAFMHEEVGRIHSQVFSTADSPVRYSGNSQQLQLWVAICLMRYFIDQYQLLYRELDSAEREHVLALGKPLATVLNVDESAWPENWDAYERYFAAGIDAGGFDAPVRDMLDDLCAFGPLAGTFLGGGTLAQRLVGPTYRSYTRFGIPGGMREKMRWRIATSDRRRKSRIDAVARVADRALPTPLRSVYTIALWDMRVRRKLGIAVF